MDFRQEIEEIKNKFGDGLSKVFTEHTNSIIKNMVIGISILERLRKCSRKNTGGN